MDIFLIFLIIIASIAGVIGLGFLLGYIDSKLRTWGGNGCFLPWLIIIALFCASIFVGFSEGIGVALLFFGGFICFTVGVVWGNWYYNN